MKKDATSKSSAIYSAPLQRLLEGKPPTVGLFLDKKVREAFRSDIASPHQRQGNSAAFFCYLLIDPTLVYAPAAECSFQDFMTAVFYVGKGKKSRPVQHLVDAAKSRSSAIPKSDKLKRILSLWDAGRGVVSLQVFQNVISVESHCREGAMLEAIGIRNLTNLKRGEYYDICIQWTSRQREEFGAFLLLSAWKIFRIEGSREIFEKDVL
ncbi:hypothetical protein L596_018195 [Steinernema carpocapsae]|uniref:GIY-YIG domain-containing protein n=1 Tax=Steinernema carpocapsae TaxID=34508 RepID=A0A4U5N3Y1_STECR|nr:hypothetical protein L596_018195 [Steinernema carpocapsae]